MISEDKTCRVIQNKLWNSALKQVPNTSTLGSLQVSSDVQLEGLSKAAWTIKDITDQVRGALMIEMRRRGLRSTARVFPPYSPQGVFPFWRDYSHVTQGT